MNKIVQFAKEAYNELTKATWLARKDVIASTWAVSIIVLLVAAYISLVDFGLSIFMQGLLGGR